MNGDLRLADGTPVRIIGDLPVGECIPLKSYGPRTKWDCVETDVYLDESASFTSADLQALMDKVQEHYLEPSEVYLYINKERYWELQYLAQGKRYPRTKRRKSKARMSRKWRNRA